MTVKERNIERYVFTILKINIVLFGEKGKDSLLNGVEEVIRIFKYVENKINDTNLGQRIRYRFPKLKTKVQLENVFVLHLETYNDLEFAEAYAA